MLYAGPTGVLTFLLTDYGKPWSNAGFGYKIRDWCDAAGLPQCSVHGLRKAAAAELAELGCTAHEIMAITGHESLQEVERYTKAAGQECYGEVRGTNLEHFPQTFVFSFIFNMLQGGC